MGSAENNPTDGELFSLEFETAFKSAFIVSKPRICILSHMEPHTFCKLIGIDITGMIMGSLEKSLEKTKTQK